MPDTQGPLDPLGIILGELRAFRDETHRRLDQLATKEEVRGVQRRHDEQLDDFRRHYDGRLADLGSDLVDEKTARIEADTRGKIDAVNIARDEAAVAADSVRKELAAQAEKYKAQRRWLIGAVLVPIGLFLGPIVAGFLNGGAS